MLEDIGERGYRLDRYLNQLKMSSIYKTVQSHCVWPVHGWQRSRWQESCGISINGFCRNHKSKLRLGVPQNLVMVLRNRPLVFGSTVDINKNEMHWSTSSL